MTGPRFATHRRRIGTSGRILLDGVTTSGFTIDLDDLGRGDLTLPGDDPRAARYPDLFDEGAIIDVVHGHRRFAWLVDDGNDTVLTAGTTVDGPYQPSGPGLLAYLADGILEPAGGFGIGSPDIRPFDWRAPDYNDSAWTTPWSRGTQAVPDPRIPNKRGKPDGWPAPDAEWIWTRDLEVQVAPDGYGDQSGVCYLRGTWTPQVAAGTQVRVYVTAIVDIDLHVQGRLELSRQRRERGDWARPSYFDIIVPDVDVVFAARVRAGGRPSDFPPSADSAAGFIFAVVTLDADGSPADVLFTSSTDDWVVLDYPADTPNVTWGDILVPTLEEGQARGVWADLTWTFTRTHDSDDVAWADRVAFDWPVGTSQLDIVRHAVEFGLHVEMTPDLELRVVQTVGTDRTGSPGPLILRAGVNVLEVRESPRGVLANALAVRTQTGWAWRTDTGSIAAYRRKEATVEVGGADRPDDVDLPVGRVLARDGRPVRYATITAVDTGSIAFGRDYDLADTVLIPTRRGLHVPARILSATPAGTADDGQAIWQLDCIHEPAT